MSRLLALLLVGALLPTLAGCDSGNGGSGDCGSGPLASGSLNATVGGQAFDAVCLSGSLSSGVLTVGGNLGATSANVRQLILTIPNAQAGQTYTSGINVTYTSIPSGGDPMDPNNSYVVTPIDVPGASATVRVTAVSATGATGTFSFTARNQAGSTVQATGGSFDVEF